MQVELWISTPHPFNPRNQLGVVKFTANVCDTLKHKDNFWTQMFLENFDKSANFKLECPFKKGEYILNGWEFTDRYIPKRLIRKVKYEYTLKAFVKSSKNAKEKIEILHVKSTGEVK